MSVHAESSIVMGRTSKPRPAVPGATLQPVWGPGAPWQPAREARPADGPGEAQVAVRGDLRECGKGPESGGLCMMTLNWGLPGLPHRLPRGTPSAPGLELLP